MLNAVQNGSKTKTKVESKRNNKVADVTVIITDVLRTLVADILLV